ncbi:AraC family transcriptional regulator [Paenibacillus sp. SYP-B3998]|uniref:AraC family transcriptional regulator n=1 Tax=Paenibacillus sp. SYP-B3998 TaxID=2678564 RepID=A0A6G4A178_9BACL|nr:AraC family transcriptional regulator [Paenibacillus sp. SYP-B3998]NEW07397.1 AraC family transcriptional regulator [Paenibacillus sp. SYP-B3998]
MTTYMDYTISSKPIRIIDRTTDKSKLNIKSLAMISVGHLPNRKLYRRTASFQHYALVYIAGGSGTYRINNGEQMKVGKGSFFFFFPGAVFDYGPAHNETWDEFYFTVEGSRLQEWLDTWLTELDKVHQIGTDDAQQSKIDRIFMLMESGDPANLDRAALLLESFLYELVLSSQPRLREPSADPMTKLLDDISASIHHPFDAAEVCERHHISLSTLRRMIHKATGYSLNEYVHRLKISEAKNMLLNTHQSVKETAVSLGFKDVFYFSRLFKKYVGVSPQHFRTDV